jgi:hypothetical protein
MEVHEKRAYVTALRKKYGRTQPFLCSSTDPRFTQFPHFGVQMIDDHKSAVSPAGGKS